MAFPPYWFLSSDEGRRVLERRIVPTRADLPFAHDRLAQAGREPGVI